MKFHAFPIHAAAVAITLLAACGDEEASRSERTAQARSGADAAQNAANTPGGTATGQPGGANMRASGGVTTTQQPQSGTTMSGGNPGNPSPGTPAGGADAGTRPETGPVTSSGAAGGTGATVGSGATPGTAATASSSAGRGAAASAADTAKGAVGTTEKRFLTQAASSGMMEVEASKVVQQQASSPEVRQFAQRLVRDHQAANAELQSLAASKGVPLPDQMSREDRATVDKLRKMQGRELDRAYLERLGRDHHRKDIEEFERAARESNDPDVRAFVERRLPVLREHYAQAQQLTAIAGAK